MTGQPWQPMAERVRVASPGRVVVGQGPRLSG